MLVGGVISALAVVSLPVLVALAGTSGDAHARWVQPAQGPAKLIVLLGCLVVYVIAFRSTPRVPVDDCQRGFEVIREQPAGMRDAPGKPGR